MASTTVCLLGGVVALDLSLHQRFEQSAGLNWRGYRGRVLGAKQPGEQRVVVLGGSTALGYGVLPEQSIPAQLERMLNARRTGAASGTVHVINAAYNSEGAYAYQYNLRDFAYLKYDLAIFYTGYNDLGGEPNTFIMRQQSPIFQLTGYFPIFPLIFREKAMALRYGGDLDAAYRQNSTTFRPSLTAGAAASALDAAARISDSLNRQLGRLSQRPAAPLQPLDTGCDTQWAFYCQAMQTALKAVLARGLPALVVDQPYISDNHIEQQRALAGMLKQHFGHEPRVAYLNLGPLLDLRDRSLAYDGMHLTAAGSEIIATQLVEPVARLLDGNADSPRPL